MPLWTNQKGQDTSSRDGKKLLLVEGERDDDNLRIVLAGNVFSGVFFFGERNNLWGTVSGPEPCVCAEDDAIAFFSIARAVPMLPCDAKNDRG